VKKDKYCLIIQNRPPEFREMLKRKSRMFSIPDVKYVYLYPHPINMKWGEKKLSEICKCEMGIDPGEEGVFLFFNAKKDQLKLFFMVEDGSQEIQKLLPNSNFLLPVGNEGEKFVKIEMSKIGKIFR
jgi:hypothetical protein